MSNLSLENLFTTSIIDNSVVTIIQVYKYDKIIMILFKNLKFILTDRAKFENYNFQIL